MALYCGDSKPLRINDFLFDFVNEGASLINNALTITGKHYSFEIIGFVCDTPARLFIKSCKGHGGFYACERCIVIGSTINKKRIYSEVDCELRTKDSFTNKKQLQQHTGNMNSPLILIPNFDPVHQVFLDSMHIFPLGVMKKIFGKFIDTSSKYKLGTQQKN